MKTLKYFFVIILSVLAGDQIVSKTIKYFHSKTFTGMSGGKVNYLIDNFPRIPVLAIGNSRCAHHVIPEVIRNEGVYNLSHNGMDLIFHAGIIDQLINYENIKIDTILLHIEAHEMFNLTSKRSRDIQYLKRYYGSNKWIKNEISQLSYFEPVKYLLSSYKWNGNIISVFMNSLKSRYIIPPKNGYVSKPSTKRDSINVSWTYKNRKTLEESNIINPNFDLNISHIKELCMRSGIKLICFLSPTYKPSKKQLAAQKIKIKSYFKKLNICFYDYSEEYYKNIELQYIWNWTDCDHLNSQGAFVFSQALKKDLIKYD